MPTVEPPKIFKVLVSKTDEASIYLGDAIRYQGGIWLAVGWTERQADGLIYPTRLIRLDRLPHQAMAAGNPYGVEYVLNDPLPKELFADSIPSQLADRYDVLDRPAIGVQPHQPH